MKVKNPNRLRWMFGVLLLAALACQSTTATPTATPAPASTSAQNTVPSGPPTQNPNAPVNLPTKHLDNAGDQNSSVDATKKMAPGGETFVQGLYERPFNANTMDVYFPYVDIVNIQGFKDDTWGYATITMSGADASGHLPAKYGVELDINRDGRGDWLILANNPSATDWTTQGVQAWKDANGDVGGKTPMYADKMGGDGYETLVFDQGKGDNPSDVFAKVDANDPNTVVIAFKLSMLGNPPSYAMGGWAGTDALNPVLFDMNDHMTHQQAGSPLPDLTTYPLKALSEIDNTCRLAIGFAPKGNEPGLCKTAIVPNAPSVPGAPPPPGCTNGPCSYGQMPYPNCQCIPG